MSKHPTVSATIQDYIARIFSVLFHPLIMPSLGMILIFRSEYYFYYLPAEIRYRIFALVLIGTYVLPLLFIPFFIWSGIARNIEMPGLKERILPIFITAVLYYVSYRSLSGLIYVHPLIKSFVLGSAIAVLLTGLISIRWKISIHTVGAGGLIGLLAVLMTQYQVYHESLLIIALLIAGLTGSARLRLNVHNNLQVYAGYALGIMAIVITMFFYP